MGWFEEAGLGLFVHWDHASQQGLEVSWPMVGGVFALPGVRDVPVAQYHSSAATFDPTSFDAGELAAQARRAGCRYGVFTAKHHSGYAMFDTAWSDFGVMHSPCGRDLVREFVEAFRAEGLRVGLYLSLSDWSCPWYPAFTEEMKPYRFGASPPLPSADDWAAYLDVLFGQVRELLTGYGPVDLLWFDGGWERPAAMWKADELVALMRSLQPSLVWNDRLPGGGGYATPEQFVPASAPASGRWETCMTMNESWGWVPEDRDDKSARALVHALCEAAGRGGNLLLNVSPTGTGALPPEQVSRLAEVGGWMARHDAAVCGVEPGLEPWQFYGPSTRRGSSVYVFCLMRPYDSVVVRGVPTARVSGVTLVGTGEALKWRARTSILDRLTDDRLGEVVVSVPPDSVDDLATVIRLDFRT